jgi:hypothetical protein
LRDGCESLTPWLTPSEVRAAPEFTVGGTCVGN